MVFISSISADALEQIITEIFYTLEEQIIQGAVEQEHEVISSVLFGGGSHYFCFH